MKHLIGTLVSLSVAVTAGAATLYEQPPTGSTLIPSSWVFENGSDSDMYAYDNFTLATDASIEQVDWYGGYQYNAMYGAVNNFSIYFYESIAGGSEPHVGNPQLTEIYLARYLVGGNAGETFDGTRYHYSYNLPTSFNATGGVKYWIRIEGFQPTYPDWGISSGSGGDGTHFAFSTGAAMFSHRSGDEAFRLSGTPVPEPTTLVAGALGIVGLLSRRRRRI